MKISEAPAGAEFDERIAAEFPEIADDSKRISEGKPPQSELFKRAAEIYGQAIADDPSLKNSESVVLMAARQAKAEAAKKGKDVPEAGALRVR